MDLIIKIYNRLTCTLVIIGARYIYYIHIHCIHENKGIAKQYIDTAHRFTGKKYLTDWPNIQTPRMDLLEKDIYI